MKKDLTIRFFLIVLIIALLAFAYRVFVYDQYFNPDTLFLKAAKSCLILMLLRLMIR